LDQIEAWGEAAGLERGGLPVGKFEKCETLRELRLATDAQGWNAQNVLFKV
jgi:hypothetical protein